MMLHTQGPHEAGVLPGTTRQHDGPGDIHYAEVVEALDQQATTTPEPVRDRRGHAGRRPDVHGSARSAARRVTTSAASLPATTRSRHSSHTARSVVPGGVRRGAGSQAEWKLHGVIPVAS